MHVHLLTCCWTSTFLAMLAVTEVSGGHGCVLLAGFDFFRCGGAFAVLAIVVFNVFVGVIRY